MNDGGDEVPPPPSVPAAAPGWYPTTPGMQGYWDGSRWTGDTAPLPGAPAPAGAGNDNGLALLAHLLGLFTGFLGPLIIYLVKKDESPYIRHHGAEALNFQLTLIIAYLASFVLIFVLIGLLLLPAVWITGVVLGIIASVAANRGEWYRYPLTIRFVS